MSTFGKNKTNSTTQGQSSDSTKHDEHPATSDRHSTISGGQSAISGRHPATSGRHSTTSGRHPATSGRHSTTSGGHSATSSGGDIRQLPAEQSNEDIDQTYEEVIPRESPPDIPPESAAPAALSAETLSNVIVHSSDSRANEGAIGGANGGASGEERGVRSEEPRRSVGASGSAIKAASSAEIDPENTLPKLPASSYMCPTEAQPEIQEDEWPAPPPPLSFASTNVVKRKAPPPPPPSFHASADVLKQKGPAPQPPPPSEIPFTIVNESACRGRDIQLPIKPIKKSPKSPFSARRMRITKKNRPSILPPKPSNDERTNEQTDELTDEPDHMPTVSEIEEFFDQSAITKVYNFDQMTVPWNFSDARYTLNLNKHSPK